MERMFVLLESDDSDDELAIDIVSSSSSSSSDEEDENIIMFNALLGRNRGPLELRPRILDYVERTIPGYTAEEFKSHFRLYPDTFQFIMGLIGNAISCTKSVSGRKPIDPEKQLLLTLWKMATPDSYRSICQKFNVGKATAIRTVSRVSYALHCLAPQFIQWPTGARAIEVMEQFERNSAFPRGIGAIDGTHIKILASTDDAQAYVNRKQYHSVQVQAVCTHDLLFTSVLAGYAGSVHDARVFRLSKVKEYLETPAVYFPNDSHIIGDAAYGVHPNVMVPFRDNGHLSARQKNFNFCLSSARISIERAFGVWKTRWRSVYDTLPDVKLEKIPQFLLATFVLHNICILRGDVVRAEPILRVHNRNRLVVDQRMEGEAKRVRISNEIIMRNI